MPSAKLTGLWRKHTTMWPVDPILHALTKAVNKGEHMICFKHVGFRRGNHLCQAWNGDKLLLTVSKVTNRSLVAYFTLTIKGTFCCMGNNFNTFWNGITCVVCLYKKTMCAITTYHFLVFYKNDQFVRNVRSDVITHSQNNVFFWLFMCVHFNDKLEVCVPNNILLAYYVSALCLLPKHGPYIAKYCVRNEKRRNRLNP